MKNFVYLLCLAAALVSACAVSPSVTPTHLPSTSIQTAETTPTLPVTVTATHTLTASATAVPATMTPYVTRTAAPSATATATLPAPLAASTYLNGAQVLEYAPLDREYKKFDLLKGDIRFEEGRLLTKAARWDRPNWVEISYNDMFFASTAVLIEFKFNGAGNYFSARFYANGDVLGLSYTSEGGFEPTANGKSPIQLGRFQNNYTVRAGEWNSMLLAMGKDGRFRAMIIDPQRPQRISCWETQKPEWVGTGLTLGISNYSGTLELRNFKLIQFDTLEKCFK